MCAFEDNAERIAVLRELAKRTRALALRMTDKSESKRLNRAAEEFEEEANELERQARNGNDAS
ncbi:MAG: hypothetical protein JOY64_00585 [Alphaproteobacteria bacterium]|nr:hypothetical protein [Alphaproteobacteria bacterium]MBV8406100.1 hypothetical protein [Alphaproteobacteria bacterium]